MLAGYQRFHKNDTDCWIIDSNSNSHKVEITSSLGQRKRYLEGNNFHSRVL